MPKIGTVEKIYIPMLKNLNSKFLITFIFHLGPPYIEPIFAIGRVSFA